jgi:hypothetical protein
MAGRHLDKVQRLRVAAIALVAVNITGYRSYGASIGYSDLDLNMARAVSGCLYVRRYTIRRIHRGGRTGYVPGDRGLVRNC